ncbi:hypothetical protein S40285_08607 [Stachybotrys chlorohalonatus IBT 40285]|uniref:Uncharacterized protein n=1 Tax=Stachybotrys chlorohalonatus (strain IBT 40285) TaxID=1283841 RepID=A0A084QYE0_STAC4|nr:hypothetical protein S40285_08607 [Stachybotrys chlorohalonata IBT 40285]
MNSSARFAGSP